jgi:hypothetical protein
MSSFEEPPAVCTAAHLTDWNSLSKPSSVQGGKTGTLRANQ